MRLERDDEDRVPMFSKRLIDAVRSRIQAGEQSILFLNKRGYSRQLQCACGYVPTSAAFDVEGSYETNVSSMRKGADDAYVEAAVKALKKLKK